MIVDVLSIEAVIKLHGPFSTNEKITITFVVDCDEIDLRIHGKDYRAHARTAD